MLLKYRNSAVRAVSISPTLTKIPALAARPLTAERHVMSNDRAEESALINFFRQVVTKPAPEESMNQSAVIVPLRRTASKANIGQTQTAAQSKKTFRNIRQATNELLARLGMETKTPESTSAASTNTAPSKTAAATIYKYRSKASITYYDLPAVVNQ